MVAPAVIQNKQECKKNILCMLQNQKRHEKQSLPCWAEQWPAISKHCHALLGTPWVQIEQSNVLPAVILIEVLFIKCFVCF